MGTRFDHREITDAELHRHDLDCIAARGKQHRRAARDLAASSGDVPVLAERRHLLASLDRMWDAADEAEVEHADPLGVWSYGKPRRPLVRLDTRVALDWGVWAVLMVLAGYLAAGR